MNPDESVRAGLLTLLLPLVGGLVRVLVLVDAPAAIAALLFAGVSGAALALVASHFGVGVQRRQTAMDAGR